MIKKLLFTFFLVFIQFVSFSQSTGDYRSKVANGNWNDVASWEYYNGSNWVSATSYPGEAEGTGTVTILNGDNITLNANITNSFVALVIGESATATSTSFGSFSVGGDFRLETLDVIINKYAVLQFTDNKGSLYLPVGAGMLIDPLGGLATPGGPGNCNNNINIFIGTVQFGVCTGGGALFTFDQLNNGGGTLYAKPSSNSPICEGKTIQLTGDASNPNAAVTVSYSWSIQPPTGAVFTSSDRNPTIPNAVAGTYKATLTCSATYSGVLYSNSETISVTVNPLPATPTITGATTLCAGESVTLTSSATSGNQWYNGGVLISGATGTTYSATTSGTYTVITNNGTCSSLASAGSTVTVNALPTTPTLSGATDATCTTDGSFTITNYNAAYTYTFTPSTGVIQSGATITAPAGSYTVTATSGTCTSVVSTPIVILSSTATWDGSSWDNLPTSDKSLVFNGPFSSSDDLEGCSCTVNFGFSVVINSGHTLRITNSVKTYGQLIFEDKSSLVQINSTPGINTGAIEYRRISSPMKNYDFTYWSSPVAGQTTVALSPNTLADKYFRFSGSANNWVLHQGVMKPGEGYIIRVPKPGTYTVYPEVVSSPTYSQPVAFKGVPNNGDYNFAVGANQWNLIGNPYPSAIKADDFINENSSLLYGGALYFWTHNTAIQLASNITNGSAGSGVYAYTSDDYATYTLVGGTATSVGNFVDANNNSIIDSGEEMSSNRPTGFIAAGQSFFVGNTIAGNFVFKNAMRLVGNNSQFFKIASTKKTKTIEKNRVWLNLTNSQGAFKQLLVGYLVGATNSWDNLYDGSSFDGNSYVNFYSINENKNLSIQGRSLPFDENDQVPLGYNAKIAGDFKISIDQTDGLLTEQAVYLEDKSSNTIHNLRNGAYTFTTVKGVFNDRFVLRYNNTNKTLGTDESKMSENKIIVSVKERQLEINSFEEAIDKVWIYDLLGRQIFTKEKVDSSEFVISNLVSAKQTLIVKVLLQNGQIYTDKVVY